MPEAKRVLVLCTGNSCRSQMIVFRRVRDAIRAELIPELDRRMSP